MDEIKELCWNGVFKKEQGGKRKWRTQFIETEIKSVR